MTQSMKSYHTDILARKVPNLQYMYVVSLDTHVMNSLTPDSDTDILQSQVFGECT